VINFPIDPITGNKDTNERTACTEAKQQTKAKFFASNSNPGVFLNFGFCGGSE